MRSCYYRNVGYGKFRIIGAAVPALAGNAGI